MVGKEKFLSILKLNITLGEMTKNYLLQHRLPKKRGNIKERILI
jgi:hypothetical protein